MELKDYYLKFKSKEEAIKVFSTIPGHTYEDESEVKIVTDTKTFSIWEVGILYTDGVYDTSDTGEFITIKPPIPKEGYHFNYRIVWGQGEEIPLPEQLEPYVGYPKTPKTTFF